MKLEKFGHKAAIFVGMALYWTRHSIRNHPKRGGWFHMSMQQWRTSIGLTRSEQESVRELLMGAGVLEELLIGRPAVMNYRINVLALATQLSVRGLGPAGASWETAQSWFRGCHSYYKPLADVVGNIAAGLYLSYLLQRYRDGLLRGQLDNGCITASQETIAATLHLGVKVQRNARERLKRAGLIQESGSGGALVRLNMNAILMCLKGQAIKPLKGLASPAVATQTVPSLAPQPEASPAPATATAVNLSQLGAAFRQLSLGLTNAVIEAQASTPARPRDFLMSVLADDAPVGNRQVNAPASPQNNSATDSKKSSADRDLLRSTTLITMEGDTDVGFAVSCKLESAVSCNQELPKPAIYIQRDYFNTTTTLRSGSGDDVPFTPNTPQAPVAELIVPSQVTGQQRFAVLEVVAKAPAAEQQRLLDELAGQLRSKTINNPAGWLYGLMQKMKTGQVTLIHADDVAASRAPKVDEELMPERVNPRFTHHANLQEAQRLIQPGFVYRLETTGALVMFDVSTKVLRQKAVNDAWRVQLSGKHIVEAHLAGKLVQLTPDEGALL